ncbi:MAG: hypothetical protein NT154_00735 [Verrucomicrobia bacterium]|nr:hypothetical protein [Verrucomicrobiota bacterium]
MSGIGSQHSVAFEQLCHKLQFGVFARLSSEPYLIGERLLANNLT